MAINYDKKIIECALTSAMNDGNVAQGVAIKSICQSPKPLFITGFAGTGKAQPLYAKVLTPDGFKEMGDMKIGSKVMSPDGTVQSVTGVFPQGLRHAYKVTFSDGSSADCDGEHLWVYRIDDMDPESSFTRCDTLNDLIDFCPALINPSEEMKHRCEIPMTSPIEYEAKEYYIHPYIAGVLIGSGDLTQKSITFTCKYKDSEMKDRVEELLGEKFSLTPTYANKFLIRKTKLANGRCFNFRVEKAHLRYIKEDRFIPEKYQYGSIEQRLDFLNGLMDSLGGYSESAGMPFLETKSKQLAKDLCTLVWSLGGYASIKPVKSKKITRYKTKYQVYMMLDKNVFYMKRKKDMYTPSKIPGRFIEKVEKVEDTECQCIKVSGKDELYITDDYIVTHNTTLMKKIKPGLKNAVFLAPTGVAALNMGGQTIHSFFRIGQQPYIPEIRKGQFMDNAEYRFNSDNGKIFQSIKYLVIDEISMVRPDLLDNVADILRKYRNNHKDPFGGVKLIMVGDLFQLPPIVKEDFFHEIYDTNYFFGAKSLMASGMEMVCFDKIYRQNDDKFIEVLNKVRDGSMDMDTINTINSRCKLPEDGRGYVEIVTTNAKAMAVNELRLTQLPGNGVTFDAKVEGDYPKDAPVEKILTLKVGTRVMITRNSTEGEYVNGSLGTVSSIKKFANEITIILDNPKSEEHRKVNVVPCEFEKIKHVRKGTKIESTKIGSITQFPIKIGYSITAHKTQGLTLDCAMMDIADSFETGQFYTALSRVKSLNDLYLRHPISPKIKTSDPGIIEFYNKMKEKNGIMEPVPMEEIEKSMLSLSSGSEIDFEKFGL